ncbi:unnamed protein product [Schistocephalus solidus]|uniref:Protocadherin-11 X-linked n=1 Tax=Schistocephalus solidus TaxID=70667 RepID=A0A183STC2_SCHSO|nr:unnamed protein product [Schistocephalus solidus]
MGTIIYLVNCGYCSSDKQNLPSVIFEIVDEAQPGTVIGNIPQTLWPDTSTSFSLILTTSSKFQRFNEYFSVTKNGTLIVEKLVDRDNVNEVCGPLDCCQAPLCWIDAFVMFLVDKTSSTASILSLDSFANNRPSARLLIRIVDVNDNPPRFLVDANDHAGFTISIQEGGKVAMETLPSAVDLDSIGNGILEYRLASVDPRQGGVDVFKLTYQKPIIPSSNSSLGGTEDDNGRKLWKPSSPILMQLRDLDYEKLEDRRFDLLVTAIDGGFPALTGTLSVTVNLIDINDNAPVFLNTNSSALNLLENTTYSPNPIHQFVATDADSDENAHISYSLSPLNDIRIFEKFSVDAVTGSLYLTSALDFEVYSERKLFVIVVASDRGSPRRSGTTTLTVVTQDVNDNLPTIIVQENVTVIEGMNYSKPVLRFYVKDEDLVSKDKVSCRAATYTPKDAEMVAGRALLRLQEVTTNAYFLFTSGIFDYEETPRASLEIVCIDNVTNIASFDGDQKVSETVIRITIAIGDANDNYPEFGFSEFVTRIPEHAITRTIVANLTARDADTGINARITYSLMKASVQTSGAHPACDVLEALRIDSVTGLITVADGFCLDRERTNEVSVFVVAEDGGGLSTSVKLRIKLTDINDNAPLFEGQSLFAIRENFPEGFTVGLIRFTDADQNGNAVIQLQLSANNTRQVLESFDLVPKDEGLKSSRSTKKGVVTGKNEVSAFLISLTSFDRELMESFAVELVATDMGDPPLQTRKTVYVNVLDENDNAPVARFPLPGTTIGYHPKVHTNSPSGFEVCKLRATDPDKGENGTVIYDLQTHTNGSRYFSLDRHSGRLSTTWGRRRRSADFDSTPPTSGIYCLQVLIYDSGVRAIKVPWEFFVLVSPRSPLFDTVTSSPPELVESTEDLGNRTTMHQKMSQMTGVLSLFAVVILLVLIVSCVCMVRLAQRSKTKPQPPSPGAKENSSHATVFCPSSLGMVYTRSHMTLPESTVGGICTFSTMQPLKYGYGEQESWNLHSHEGDCSFLEAQERLLPTPSAKELYRPMQFESKMGNRACYSPMYPQFSL